MIANLPKRRLHLEVTGDCNIVCSYCYNSGFNRETAIRNQLSLDEQLRIISQALDMGCSSFCFSGGEPFLYKDIIRLVEACASAKRVSIITNGSLLTDGIFEQLARFNNVKELKISLDGFEGNDAVRIGSSHKQVIKAIKQAVTSLPHCKVIVNTMITKHSLPELIDLYATLKELGVQHWRIDMPFNAGRCVANARSLMQITFESVILVYRDLLTQYFADGKPMLLELFNVYKSMISDPGDYFEFDRSSHPCAYYNDTITVRPDGGLTYCPSLAFPIANWRTTRRLEQALQVATRHDFYRLEINQIGSCVDCRYLLLCGGGCRADAITWHSDERASDPISCAIMPLIERYIIPCLPTNERSIYERLINEHGSFPAPSSSLFIDV